MSFTTEENIELATKIEQKILKTIKEKVCSRAYDKNSLSEAQQIVDHILKENFLYGKVYYEVAFDEIKKQIVIDFSSKQPDPKRFKN